MKYCKHVPDNVRQHYLHCWASENRPGLKKEKAVWDRFVSDFCMEEFYNAFIGKDDICLNVLATAAGLASIDWQEYYGARENVSRALAEIQSLLNSLLEKIDELQGAKDSAALAGDDKFEDSYGEILSGRRRIVRMLAAAESMSSHSLFSWSLIGEAATDSRQYNRSSAFWRALAAALDLQHHGMPKLPAEADIPAKAMAALCSCALNQEISPEAILKRRVRTTDQ